MNLQSEDMRRELEDIFSAFPFLQSREYLAELINSPSVRQQLIIWRYVKLLITGLWEESLARC